VYISVSAAFSVMNTDMQKMQPIYGFSINRSNYLCKTRNKTSGPLFKTICASTLKIRNFELGTMVDRKKVLKQIGVVQNSKTVVSLLCMPYQKGNTR